MERNKHKHVDKISQVERAEFCENIRLVAKTIKYTP